MNLGMWTFSHYDYEHWQSLVQDGDRRVLLIAAEPNGNNPRGKKDMGDWFRTAVPANEFHSGQRFYVRNMGQLFGALNRDTFSSEFSLNANRIHQLYRSEVLQNAMRHMRYADLKAIEGGGTAYTDVIKTWVLKNVHRVLDFWFPMDGSLSPTHVVVQGGHAHTVYQEVVLDILRDRGFDGVHIGMPHPSNSIGYEKNRLLTMQMEENFRPITEPLKILRLTDVQL